MLIRHLFRTFHLPPSKTIRDHLDFEYVTSLLPNLMLGLRHIWTMSNYFSNDEKMQMLLYKISFVFTEKVKSIVTLDKIFKCRCSDAYQLATNCAKLLLAWKTSYLTTRNKVELAQVGSRWEFSKAVLFDDVDHCARISNDIANISLVFVQFENIFGAHLKSLVYNPDDVTNIMNKVRTTWWVSIVVLKVIEMFLRPMQAYKLIDFIGKIDYNIFRPGNLENWEASLNSFNKRLQTIEIDAKDVLDKCIPALKLSEQGIVLINNIDTMNTRTALAVHMRNKRESVLEKFIAEIESVQLIFMVCSENTNS